MSADIKLNELWKSQETSSPGVRELLEKAIDFRKSKLRKLVLANVLLLLTSAFIGFVWLYFQSEMVTTKLGMVLIIFSIVLYLVVYNQMIPLLLRGDDAASSHEFLRTLLRLKEKQAFFQRTMVSLYFLLLSIGLGLYMFEYASRMMLAWSLFTYGITLAWIGLNWFHFRPRVIRREQGSINELIARFQTLERQLREEDLK